MNKENRRVLTEFAPETRFEISPAPTTPFRWSLETDFERLKSRLLAQRLENTFDNEALSSLRRAANEAAELAKLTTYPLLVFPALFEEKADNIIHYHHRMPSVTHGPRVTRSV
jgi:hypothetical protein